ncbi:E3 ubiquitin-protein ligase TTC3-like isoform X3 [Pomacea canaliculata]|nr:E3 ubiquitin-protein ligase TTC3-like isoform X3 [Pomacea canaliculata]
MNPDDLPDLAPPDDSTEEDEEEEEVLEENGDCDNDDNDDDEDDYFQEEHLRYVQHWVSQSPEFLQGESKEIRTEALGLFLLGTGAFTSTIWIKALHHTHVLNDGREWSTGSMTDEEFEIVDILVAIIEKNLGILKDETKLKQVLAMINEMESSCVCSSVIEVDRVLEVAKHWPFFLDAWEEFKEKPKTIKYTRQTLMLLIYFFRLVSQNVFMLGRDGRTLAIKLTPLGQQDQQAYELKSSGDGAFNEREYDRAVHFYTQALVLNFALCYLYRQRGQAYFFLQKFREAYCDFRRAMFLDGTFQEDYYHLSAACFALQRLEEAEKWNAKGLKLDGNVRATRMMEQQQSIKKALDEKISPYKYNLLTKEALECVLKNDMHTAHKKYQGALSIVLNSTYMMGKLDKTEVTTLRYACGITTVSEDSPARLQDALDIFISMYKEELANSFPLIYYGLGSVLVAQRRFQEAARHLELGLNLSRKMRKKWKLICWPNTNQIIEESRVESFQKAIENLLKKCRPAPVAGISNSDHKEDSKIQKFQTLTKEAMEALHHDNHLRAFGKFQASYELLTRHQSLKDRMSEIGILALRYACGITAATQNALKPLQEGLEIFLAINREGLADTFPLTYYGLGKNLIALYRFGEALRYVDHGVNLPKKIRKNLQPICWPSSKKIIEESKPAVFQQQMEGMLKVCRYPPIPDAVCAVHISEDDKEPPIYFNDPSFSGVIRVECYFHCKIAFHPSCWVHFKSRNMDKSADKDVINHTCPTPDCGSLVKSILICRPGAKNRELVSSTKPQRVPAPPPKILKMPKSNQEKIDRKAERKERRRRKRQEVRSVYLDREMMEIKDDGSALFEKQEIRTIPNPAAMTLLKKEDENDIKYQGIQRQVKQKKKKEKVKQLLNVEVNFTDKDKSTLLGEHSLRDETEAAWMTDVGNQESLKHMMPGAILGGSVAMGRASYSIKTEEAISENLYEFFGEILKAHGPLSLNDPILRRELSLLPPEAIRVIQKAGGPSRFFRQCLKFVVIDEIVATIADTRQAHELAKGLHPSAMLSTTFRGLMPSNGNLAQAEGRGGIAVVNGVVPSALQSRFDIDVAQPSNGIIMQTKKDVFNGTDWNVCDVSHTLVNSAQPLPLKPLSKGSVYGLGTTYNSVSNSTVGDDDDDNDDDDESVEQSVCSGKSEGPSRIRSLSGSLNPSAPEFRPGKKKVDTVAGSAITEFNSKHNVFKYSETASQEYRGSGARPKVSDLFPSHKSSFLPDTNPTTDFSNINDVDDFTLPISKDLKDDIDSLDDACLMPITHPGRLGNFRGSSQTVPEQSGLGLSRRSSRSDMSETSDLSMGNFFRTSSPSSSISSFRGVDAYSSSSPRTSQDLPSAFPTQAVVPHKLASSRIIPLQEQVLPQESVKTSSSISNWPTKVWSCDFLGELSEKVGLGESASTPPPPHPYIAGGLFSTEEHKPTKPGSDDADDKEISMDRHVVGSGNAFAAPGSVLYRPGPISSVNPTSYTYENKDSKANDWFFQTGSTWAPPNPSNKAESPVSISPAWPASIPVSSSSVLPFSLDSVINSCSSAFGFSSTSAWSSNTFPSAIRPEEDLFDSIKPASLTLLTESRGSASLVSNSTLISQVENNKKWEMDDDDKKWEIDDDDKKWEMDDDKKWEIDDDDKKWEMDEDREWDALPASSLLNKDIQACVEVQAAEMNTEVVGADALPSSLFLLDENRRLKCQVQELLDDKKKLLVTLEHYKEINRLNSSQLDVLQQDKSETQKQSQVTFQNLSAEHERREKHMQDIISHLELNRLQMARDADLLKQKLSGMEEEMHGERSRALEAEIEVVRLRQQLALMQLELKRKEAEFHQHYTSMFARRCQEKGEVPEKVSEVLEYWKNVLSAFALRQAKIKKDFDEVINYVKAGKRLSDLPPVSISPPPLPRMPEGGIPVAKQMPSNGQLPYMPQRLEQNQFRPSPTPSPPNSTHSADADIGASATQGISNPQVPQVLPGLRTPRPLVPPKGLPSLPLTTARPAVPQPAIPVVTQASFAAAAVRPILRPTLSFPKPPSPLTVVPSTQQPPQPNQSMAAAIRAKIGPAGDAAREGVARIVSSGQTGKTTSFDKVVMKLQKSFPSCTRENFSQLIQELRRAHGGSLSGMSLEVILTRVTQMAIARGFKHIGNGEPTKKNSSAGIEYKTTIAALQRTQGVNPVWNMDGAEPVRRPLDWSELGAGDNFEEEDPCAICHEELSSAPITTLDCRHQFHDECIRKWFKEQTTCPNCRVHSLLQDDYPVLK